MRLNGFRHQLERHLVSFTAAAGNFGAHRRNLVVVLVGLLRAQLLGRVVQLYRAVLKQQSTA